MSDFKKTIIDALDLLRRKEESNRAFFKVKAYKKVIEELREHIRMRAMGQRVEVIDSIEGVERLLAA
jgi:hypothetical protein